MSRRSLLKQPITYTWLITNFLFLFLDRKGVFEARGIDGTVLLAGNFLLYLVAALSYWITLRSFKSDNPHAFVRAVYLSFIIKFFVVAITAFVYIRVAGKEVNKPGLLLCMGLFLVYTFLSVRSLTNILKRSKNA